MTTFGDILREERESQGIDLEEIASATKIGRRYLEALEKNEFGRLPGGAFTKGFVRAYAEYIGSDPKAMVVAYQNQINDTDGPQQKPEMLQEVTRLAEIRAERNGNRTRPVVRRGVYLAAALFGALAAAVWIWSGNSDATSPVTRSASGPSSRQASVELSRAQPVQDPRFVPVSMEDTMKVEGPRATTVAAVEAPDPPPETVVGSAFETTAADSAAEIKSPVETTGVSNLSVTRYGVGTDIINRQLVGESDQFAAGQQVWFWTRAVGGSAGEVIRHVWTHENRPPIINNITVGGPHWRNYTRQTLQETSIGHWTVEAQDGQGRLLARTEFICLPASQVW